MVSANFIQHQFDNLGHFGSETRTATQFLLVNLDTAFSQNNDGRRCAFLRVKFAGIECAWNQNPAFDRFTITIHSKKLSPKAGWYESAGIPFRSARGQR